MPDIVELRQLLLDLRSTTTSFGNHLGSGLLYCWVVACESQARLSCGQSRPRSPCSSRISRPWCSWRTGGACSSGWGRTGGWRFFLCRSVALRRLHVAERWFYSSVMSFCFSGSPSELSADFLVNWLNFSRATRSLVSPCVARDGHLVENFTCLG